MIRVSARSRLRCAYCHADAFGAVPCPGCRTLVHPACSKEARTCPTLGCAERPPTPIEREAFVAGASSFAWVSWMELTFALGLVLAAAFIGWQLEKVQRPVDRAPARTETKITDRIR